MDPAAVAHNLAAVRDRMAEACRQAGRPADAVRLVAVSKRIPLELVAAACADGQWALGENRIQDAVPRQAELAALLRAQGLDPGRVHWHFIGHLQSNKAGRAVGAFDLLHGIDAQALAVRLDRLAGDAGVRQPVLLEVNISGEDQKNGLQPDQAVPAAEAVAALPNLDLQGLMGMARWDAPEAELRASFARLRRLAEQARTATGRPLPELSMGMSDDFPAAIAEGATIVRVGSAIFGPRG
ncbi:MAG TPA: YggS family pyridoxal phosphate-dependent enzyme [Candidatus Krumholzibacteria bacterium]|nr:YggS family pyridoxal phosphate-dependent enzyme [Candidatus Krumholzibacteria bacterium]